MGYSPGPLAVRGPPKMEKKSEKREREREKRERIERKREEGKEGEKGFDRYYVLCGLMVPEPPVV